MGGMPRAWGSYWARLSAGLGLLMLPAAAQPRLCRWLNQPPTAPTDSASEANRSHAAPSSSDKTGSPGESGKKKSRRPVLPLLVPDAAEPRWPAGWGFAQWRHTEGWHDGVVSCGPRHSRSSAPPAAPADTPTGWRDLDFIPSGLSESVPVQPDRLPQSTFLSDIPRTGPPTP